LPANDTEVPGTDVPAGGPLDAASPTLITDPTPAAFAVFAFALAVYGVRFASVNDATLSAGPATVALDYAVLAAAIANVICGILALIRGLSYPGYVMMIFGTWLAGFYLVITAGGQAAFTPDAVGWYVLFLEAPVLILAVPAFAHRDLLMSVAFVALGVLVILLGLGFHDLYQAVAAAAVTHAAPSLSGPVGLLKASAYFAFIGAAMIWLKFAVEVYGSVGIMSPPRFLGGSGHRS
jgi:hypothetical protein